jgi:NRE family putative nickel resistance protein-like MFS transporter
MIEMIIAIAGAQILVNSVGLVKGSMGLNDQYYGWIMMAFGIGATLAAFSSNSIDRSRNKRFLLLLAGTLIISAISFANFVPYPVLIFLWVLAGLGQGFTYLPSQIMVAENIPIGEQGRVYGAQFAWVHLFWAFGYLLAGFTGSRFQSMGFLVGGAVALVLFIIVLVTSLRKGS